MIGLLDIKTSITTLLKSQFAYKVHFDNVEKSNEPYFYVQMLPRITTVDEVYADKSIQIDIMLILMPDENGRIKRSLLYSAADKLDKLIRPVMQIGDRFITILNAETNFTDEILHYVFNLEFTDAEAKAITNELMQVLGLNLNYRLGDD